MKLITDQIFETLDIFSLSSAEEASVVWADVIEKGKFWEKLFKKNVSSILIFKFKFYLN